MNLLIAHQLLKWERNSIRGEKSGWVWRRLTEIEAHYQELGLHHIFIGFTEQIIFQELIVTQHNFTTAQHFWLSIQLMISKHWTQTDDRNALVIEMAILLAILWTPILFGISWFKRNPRQIPNSTAQELSLYIIALLSQYGST